MLSIWLSILKSDLPKINNLEDIFMHIKPKLNHNTYLHLFFFIGGGFIKAQTYCTYCTQCSKRGIPALSLLMMRNQKPRVVKKYV